MGGLGVKNLELHNKSLLFKWLWSNNENGEELWKMLIDTRYGREDFWKPDIISMPSKIGVWKQISRFGPEFQKFISLKVGDGEE